MLDEMRRLQERGYQPSTEDVLFDVEEEDKEENLSCHSERLAIAFALVAFRPGTPICIIKSLRVCGDCHLITKLISEIQQRYNCQRSQQLPSFQITTECLEKLYAIYLAFLFYKLDGIFIKS
ncbi:hypothetical protein Taro_053147 [Colocasia esculenta]|uniref:DYW domain-containing protein n=1 Tax=Colocasia esculenta TaxID=4460 RepID=A0A843XLQ6_COLES|nr:hypothetical protein [Colocasia esculenta]